MAYQSRRRSARKGFGKLMRALLKIPEPRVFTRPREAVSGFFTTKVLFLEVPIIRIPVKLRAELCVETQGRTTPPRKRLDIPRR